MTKAEIIKYLDLFLEKRGVKYPIATKKWEIDLEFVHSNEMTLQDNVFVNKVVPKY